MEPHRNLPDPARFWGLAQVKSEGWTKRRVSSDVKSTSHQDKGAPGRFNREEKSEGDLAEQECRAARLCRNVGSRVNSTEDIMVPAIITVTWSRLEATADSS